mgnify:CR=1 FL=1
MNGFRNFFRNFSVKLNSGLSRFMAGRYGNDKLNNAILGVGVVLCLVSLFIRNSLVKMILTTLAFMLLFWANFRTFSRNTYKRYQENRRYLRLRDQIKDKEHRYYACPRCRQTVRVPKGKGKIAITCPKCEEKFIKKT